MYSFTGQSQYGSYNSTYASSPAVYNTAAQSQPTSHNPAIGGVGGVGVSNPSSVYASFSSAVAPTPSPYPPPAYANPGAAAAAAAAAATYAQYSQTAAAVASMQQQQHQQQQHQLQNVAGGVVNASAGYPTQNATRLTDSYGTIASVASAGGAYTPLSDYANPLRTGAAGVAVPTNSVSNNSYMGMTRIGNSSGGQMMNAVSSSGSASNYNSYDAAVYAAANSYLQSKAAGAGNVWMSANKKSSDGYNNFTPASSNSSNIPITGRGYLGTRGRGTFPSKRIGHTRNPDAQLFYCEICKISCAGAQTYKEHVDGQKHKKKEALQKGEGQTLSKSRVSFRCETCNVTCTGKDTYDSHIRGSKHQKTANLMKKMGKPVTDAPTVLAPGEKSNKQSAPANGTPIATVGGPAVPTKKVIATAGIKFISGEPLQSTTPSSVRKAPENVEPAIPTSTVNNAEVEAALAKEKEVQPVGEDYVEEERNAAGKLVQFNCKLCDCKFSDPNAKNIHIKGRKHRLQYKLKVNPSLVVEMKPNQVPREMRNELARKLRSQRVQASAPRSHGPPQPLIIPDTRNWFGMAESSRFVETNEDRHVMAKHNMIYPEEEQLFAIEKMVTLTEKALKTVSDKLAEDDTKKASDGNKENSEMKERVLKGVMRVGLLAKGLLLKTDREVELVVLCSQPPTRTLLSKVGDLLPDSAKKGENEVITIVENPKESALLLKYSCSETVCRIVFTCAALRDGNQSEIPAGDGATAAASTNATPPKDPLPKVPCLEALAEQRHAKWFQARCSNLQSATVTLRILRDIRQRIPSWEPLKSWAAELLVAKVLMSGGTPLSPGDAIRRVFEAIASGILFKDGPGLLDPCEKQPHDVLSDLTGQQREDITASSQHALRLIAFNQLYKVLGIDRLTEQRGERKRPRDSNGNHSDSDALDVKKDKKDDAKAGDKKIA